MHSSSHLPFWLSLDDPVQPCVQQVEGFHARHGSNRSHGETIKKREGVPRNHGHTGPPKRCVTYGRASRRFPIMLNQRFEMALEKSPEKTRRRVEGRKHLAPQNNHLWRQTKGAYPPAGIGASPFYPSAICDLPGIGKHMKSGSAHFSKAEDLSRRLLTVPTHPYVRRRDLETVVKIVRGL